MRVPWFNWRALGREGPAEWTTTCAPHERTADEITLALRLIPLYQVRLQWFTSSEQPLPSACDWQATLAATLGAERAQRALLDLAARGVAVIAVCPRELAEHYCDELAQLALPCVVQPA